MAENTQTKDHTNVQIHDEGLKYKQQPKIQKVPELLRGIQSNNGSNPYAPMVVSIGPYHHGKPELMEMERLKLEFARLCFPSSSKEMYKTAINACEARKFYSDGSIPTEFDDDEKFLKMMFLDGCFVLHFISCFLGQKGTGMKPHLEGFVIRDLFLLENQLPFPVLEAVMNLSKGYTTKKEEGCTVEKVKEFVSKVRHSPITDEQVSRETVGKRIFVKCNEMFGKVRSLCFRTESKTIDTRNVIPKPPLHLVELFHTQFTKKNPNPSTSQGQTWYCYRSAKEINNVGIHFTPSESNNFNDVTYKSYFFYGYLSLPPLLIDDLSKSLLLNLAAYESCPDTPDDAFQVSSYIVFLDSLIDHAEDVKELRSKGVLLNSLGSDQDVADLFNEISKYLVIHPQAFRDARNGIDRRYQDKVKKWITEWLNNHFSSPWTVIAFVGASVGLGLTAIETYKSFFPPPVV